MDVDPAQVAVPLDADSLAVMKMSVVKCQQQLGDSRRDLWTL